MPDSIYSMRRLIVTGIVLDESSLYIIGISDIFLLGGVVLNDIEIVHRLIIPKTGAGYGLAQK